jgi:prepilin-type N-terminal cleavage/methylation domain-containing protein
LREPPSREVIGVRKKGFTLLELIISITVFAIILTIITSSLKRAVDLHTSVFINHSAFFEASLGMDFFEKQIRNAKKIIIPKSDEEKNLKVLTVVSDVEHVFWLNKNVADTSPRYMRLEYGGAANRLANYIKDVVVSYDENTKILTVSIIPDPQKNVEILTRRFDVDYAEVVYN